MKKLFNLFAFTIAVLLTSCSPDTPSDITKKYLNYLNDKNFEAVADLFYADPELSDEEVEKDKKRIVEMFEELAERGFQQFKTMEITSEKISEDGNEAVVGYELTFDNNGVNNDELKFMKDEDGKWKVIFNM